MSAVEPLLRILIATTKGPIAIQRVLRETEGALHSLVGIDGGTDHPAAISDSYDGFVRRPLGVINRLFDEPPYPCYRLDIETNVDAGQSFQLAVVLAHAAAKADRYLNRPRVPLADDGSSALIWATGTVSSDLRIGQIGHLSDKIRTSQTLFRKAAEQGRQITLFAPRENEVDLDADSLGILRTHGLGLTYIDTLDEALAVLGLPAAEVRAAGPEVRRISGNPYRGLDAYDAEHRGLFFGRARAREEALELLRTSAGRGRAFLLVHGPSGVGKSSFVRAGLVGDVLTSVPEEARFTTITITPSAAATPLKSLIGGLREMLRVAAETSQAPDTAGDENCSDPREMSLEALVAAITAQKAARTCSFLLVVDQGEELFDPAHEAEEAGRVADALDKLVRADIWIIVTMRSDALAQLARVPALARLASSERTYRLDRPSLGEFREIVMAPAALAGRRFEDGVAENLVSIAHVSPDSLPLLQAVLFRFFERADDVALMTHKALERLGGFEGAVGVWAEEVRESLLHSGARAEVVDRLLLSLARLDAETRRPLSRTIDAPDEPESARVAEIFVKARLVTRLDGGKNGRLRLAHEALTTHWPHLFALVTANATAMALRDEIELRAAAWEEGSGDLLGGARLAAARAIVQDGTLEISDRGRTFVETSRKEDEGTRLVSRALAAVAFAAVAVFGGGWILWNQNVVEERLRAEVRQAITAQTNGLVALAQRLLVAQDDPIGAMTIAIEALDRAVPADVPAPHAESVLIQARWNLLGAQYQSEGPSLPVSGQISRLAISTDSSRIAYSIGESVFVRELDSHREREIPVSGGAVRDLYFLGTDNDLLIATDHRLMILSSTDGELVIHDEAGSGAICAWESMPGPQHQKHQISISAVTDVASARPRQLRMIPGPAHLLTILSTHCDLGREAEAILELPFVKQETVNMGGMIYAGLTEDGGAILNMRTLNDETKRIDDLSLSSRILAVANSDGSIGVHAVATGALVSHLAATTEGPVERIAISGDGNRIAVFYRSGHLGFFRNRLHEDFALAIPSNEVMESGITSCRPADQHANTVISSGEWKVQASGNTIAVTLPGTEGHRIALPSEARQIQGMALIEERSRLRIAYSTEEQNMIVVADHDLEGRSSPTIRRITVRKADRMPILCVALSATGNLVAAVSDRFFEVFSLTSDAATPLSEFEDPNYRIEQFTFSPDGKRYFVLTHSYLHIFDTPTGVLLFFNGPYDGQANIVAAVDNEVWVRSRNRYYRTRYDRDRDDVRANAIRTIPFCLGPADRVNFGLPATVPDWCEGKEIAPPR